MIWKKLAGCRFFLRSQNTFRAEFCFLSVIHSYISGSLDAKRTIFSLGLFSGLVNYHMFHTCCFCILSVEHPFIFSVHSSVYWVPWAKWPQFWKLYWTHTYDTVYFCNLQLAHQIFYLVFNNFQSLLTKNFNKNLKCWTKGTYSGQRWL